MAFSITREARLKALEGSKEPQLVLEIDGIDTIFGSTDILKYISIGDADLYIDGSWSIGGTSSIEDQLALISIGSDVGTTTKITQSLDPEKGRGSSVSSMTIGLIDQNEEITRVISPGQYVTDIMGRRCRVYLGFSGTAYKQSFIPVFKGIVDDVQALPGQVRITIGSSEQKKRQDVFIQANTETFGVLDASSTTIAVAETTNFLVRQNKPDGTPETALETFIKIEDEIIQYTGLIPATDTTPGYFTGCTRGKFGTTATTHDDKTSVDSMYRLKGNGIELSLKLMLSGLNDYFETEAKVKSFVYIDPDRSFNNSIFFEAIDVEEKYGLTIGDWVTVEGSPSNDFIMRQITDIETIDIGSYIVVDGLPLVSEVNDVGTVAFRSQWDSLGIGAGASMIPDDVDVAQHLYLKNMFFSSYELDFFITDTVNVKDWIEAEIYLPVAMFSVPRKARASVQAHSGPIPTTGIKTLNDTNITNPTKLSLRRSLGKNFYNSIIYKYDQEPTQSKFLSGDVVYAQDSKNRIDVGNRALKIESKGLRTELSAQTLISTFSNRRLKRYKFAAEFIEGVEVTYGTGYELEVGDIVILDGSKLAIADTTTGTRGKESKFFEITNKSIDVKTGKITLALVDTAFDVQSRFGTIGLSSLIKDGISTSQFVIKPDGLYSNFDNESDKWTKFKFPRVRVRDSKFTKNETTVVQSISGGVVTVNPPLTFTPTSNMIMELTRYTDAIKEAKMLYAFMTDTPFTDGGTIYLII